MMSRYLSISLLAVSSTLFGVSCNRVASGDPQPAASCEPPWAAAGSGVSNPTGQWDRLIAGNPGLSAFPFRGPPRRGAGRSRGDQSLHRHPEGRVSTVSTESHYSQAVLHYREALRCWTLARKIAAIASRSAGA
jgi:hypothetical protein